MNFDSHSSSRNENKGGLENVQKITTKPTQRVAKPPMRRNRETFRQKWKEMSRKKKLKAFVKGVNDVNVLSKKYMCYFSLKQKLFLRKWKNHMLWRQISREILLNERIESLKNASDNLFSENWKKILQKTRNEIKFDNFYSAFADYSVMKKENKYFSKWKESHMKILSIKENIRETWINFIRGLNKLEFEERLDEAFNELQANLFWTRITSQYCHETVINNLMMEKNHLDLKRKWRWFVQQKHSLVVKTELEYEYRHLHLLRKWHDIKDIYMHELVITSLEESKAQLEKSLLIYVLISKATHNELMKNLKESKAELDSKRRTKTLKSTFENWLVNAKASKTVRQVSKESYQNSMNEYARIVSQQSAVVIQRWFRRANYERKIRHSINERTFMTWRARHLCKTLNEYPVLEAKIDGDEIINTDIPIEFDDVSLDVIYDIYKYHVAKENNETIITIEDAKANKEFVLPKECINMINQFIPNDIEDIVSQQIESFDILQEHEEEINEPQQQLLTPQYNVSDDFYAALSHSDFAVNSDDSELSSSIIATETQIKPSVIESFGFSFETDSMINEQTEAFPSQIINQSYDAYDDDEETCTELNADLFNFTFDNTELNDSLTKSVANEVVCIVERVVNDIDVPIEKTNVETEAPKNTSKYEVAELPYKYEPPKAKTVVTFSPLPFTPSANNNTSMLRDTISSQDSDDKQDISITIQDFEDVDPIQSPQPQQQMQHQQQHEEEEYDDEPNTLECIVEMAKSIMHKNESNLRNDSDQSVDSGDSFVTHITIDDKYLNYTTNYQEQKQEVDVFDPFEISLTSMLFAISSYQVEKTLEKVEFGSQLTKSEKFFIELDSIITSEDEKNSSEDSYSTIDISKETQGFFSIQLPTQELATVPQANDVDVVVSPKVDKLSASISPPSKMVAETSHNYSIGYNPSVKTPHTSSTIIDAFGNNSDEEEELNNPEIQSDHSEIKSHEESPENQSDHPENNNQEVPIENQSYHSDNTTQEESNDNQSNNNETNNQEVSIDNHENKTQEESIEKQSDHSEDSFVKENDDNEQIIKEQQSIDKQEEEEIQEIKEQEIKEEPKEDKPELVIQENMVEETNENNQVEANELPKKGKKKIKKKKTKKAKKQPQEVLFSNIAPNFHQSLMRSIVPAINIALAKSVNFDIREVNEDLEDQKTSQESDKQKSQDAPLDSSDYSYSTKSVPSIVMQKAPLLKIIESRESEEESEGNFKYESKPKYRVDSPIGFNQISDYSYTETTDQSSIKNKATPPRYQAVIEEEEQKSEREEEEIIEEPKKAKETLPVPQEEVEKRTFAEGLMDAMEEATIIATQGYADIRFPSIAHIFDRETPSIYESAMINLSPKIQASSAVTPRKERRSNSSRTFESVDLEQPQQKQKKAPFKLKITKGVSRGIIEAITSSIANAVQLSIPQLIGGTNELEIPDDEPRKAKKDKKKGKKKKGKGKNKAKVTPDISGNFDFLGVLNDAMKATINNQVTNVNEGFKAII